MFLLPRVILVSTVGISLFQRRMGVLHHSEKIPVQNRFKRLTVPFIVNQIRSKDWFVKFDLKDAYFHTSILPQHRKLLRFAFWGEAYQ